jgi:hypothetical protein
MELATGQRLAVLDAFGQMRHKRFIAPANGTGVYVCDEDEWDASEREGREPEPEPFPWPLEDVQAE